MTGYEIRRPDFMYKLLFEAEMIAHCFGLDVNDLIAAFRDGRVSSKTLEYISCRLYGANISKNSNQKGVDGNFQTSSKLLHNDTASIECKTLTKSGIDFKQSSFKGSGRFGDLASLLHSLSCAILYAVADIIDFPEVYITPAKSKELIDLVLQDKLPKSGWGNRDQYYQNVFGKNLANLKESGVFQTINIEGTKSLPNGIVLIDELTDKPFTLKAM